MKRVCTDPHLLVRQAGGDFVYGGRERSQWGQETLAWSEGTPIRIRCRRCLNCRIRRAKEWTIRGIHHRSSYFRPTWAVTLTYADEHLPEGGSLSGNQDFQLFNKRLRHHCGEFGMMACGEYGPTTGRAHYHAIYFGLDLPDAYKGNHWGSKTLLDTWGQGNVTLHLAEDASIAYVSGYVVGKLPYHKDPPIMEVVDPESGLVTDSYEVERPFFRASRHPAPGLPWIEQFAPEVLRDGFVLIGGKKCHVIPEYYQRIMRRDYPVQFEEFAARRLAATSAEPFMDLEMLASLDVNVSRQMENNIRGGV